jgi:hypothetical protein
MKKNRNMTSYQRSLFNEYEIDEQYLQTRKQRRACLELLERVDSNKSLNEKKLIGKVAHAFKDTSLHKKIASCVTVASLLLALQSAPVMAQVASTFIPSIESERMLTDAAQKSYVIVDEDSSTASPIEQKQVELKHSMISLQTTKQTSNALPPIEDNSVLIDGDSDVAFYKEKELKELTVIDTSIEDYEVLKDAVKEGETLLIEEGDKPLDKILNKLEQMGQVGNITIISHGESGEIRFKNSVISSDDLNDNREKWEKLGGYLSQEGDIQLLGCNIAKGDEGKAFVEKLADITKADIAASINPTGSKEKGGDFELEFTTGKEKINPIVLNDVRDKFNRLLYVSAYKTHTFDKGGGPNISGNMENHVDYYGLEFRIVDSTDSTSVSYGAGTFCIYENNVFKNNKTKLTINEQNDRTFALTACDIIIFGGYASKFQIKGYKDGTYLDGASFTTNELGNTNLSQCCTFSEFMSIDMVKIMQIEGDVSWLEIDNLKIEHASEGDIVDGELDESNIISIPTTALNSANAVEVFDFKIRDLGAKDGKAVNVTALNVHTSGSDLDKLGFILDGPDVSKEGTYNSSTGLIEFTDLNISVSNEEPQGNTDSETYVVKAYFRDASDIIENTSITLSINNEDAVLDNSSTAMSKNIGSGVSNNGNAKMDVVATKLIFTTQPAGSTSGNTLTTQPVVKAVDENDNVDKDFTETVTLTENGAGTIGGTTSVSASDGVATFTDIVYNAKANGESFSLIANDEDTSGSDLTEATSNSISSTVPYDGPTVSGVPTDLTVTEDEVSNLDFSGMTFTSGRKLTVTITASEGSMTVNNGSAIGAGVTETLVSSKIVTLSGVAEDINTFLGTSSNIKYTSASNVSGEDQATITISVTDEDGKNLETNPSINIDVTGVAPIVTANCISISGATGTAGTFKIGDTVTALWDNTASGDNNTDIISSATIDFSDFGGGKAVAATNNSGTWTATYTITKGTSNATNLNVAVTATDDAGNSTTTADTSNATMDNQAPIVTDANISISGGSGTNGEFKIGDTITATWNNRSSGDNNLDISGVTVDFSAFGGGKAVVASNNSETWTATYGITNASTEGANLNVAVTATDDTGNITTTADTSNATIDNQAPIVTDGNISISGGSGTSGEFKIGDTVTATWNNTAGGDNNSDIDEVTVDFSAFGGGRAVTASNNSGTWTASYTIASSGVGGTNKNIAITATDYAGNSTTTADTSNATIDTQAPVITDANISISGGSGTSGEFKIGDIVTVTWNNTSSGDNNSDINNVTIDFSDFGGGKAVAATNNSGTWTATYTIAKGTSNATNLNVAVTATDDAGNSTTTADTSNATMDNQAPIVTDPNISISGGSGTNGEFKIGDTVTATWNNRSSGDNNLDINEVTVDFSAFGGGKAVVATNNSETWTATYTIVRGVVGGTNKDISVTVTDNVENSTTTADTTNATIDAPLADSDGTVKVGPLDESQMISIPTTADLLNPVNIFDFQIQDGGTSDGLPLSITSLNLHVSSIDMNKLKFILDGPDVTNVEGSYNSGSGEIEFTGLNISVADGASETYVIKAYYMDSTNIVDNTVITLSINNSDIMVGSGTIMASDLASNISNHNNAKMDVVASKLIFTTQPDDSISGQVLSTQPVIKAVDEFGNVDKGFSEMVTLAENTEGSLSGTTSLTASEGIANFTDIKYIATADKQTFNLIANDDDSAGTNLNVVTSSDVESDVVATKLIFSIQPSPTTIKVNTDVDFTTDPVVSAVDNNGVIDIDYSGNMANIEEDGTGNASFNNNRAYIMNGVGEFTGFTMNHDTEETVHLIAKTSNRLTDATSAAIQVVSNTSSGGSHGSGGSRTKRKPKTEGVKIIVNGKVETAATGETKTVDNKVVTTVEVDNKKVEKKLQEEEQPSVIIPVNTKADIVEGTLDVQLVKDMADKEAELEVRTEDVHYVLKTSKLNIEEISEKIGKDVDLDDIKMNIKITKAPKEVIEEMEKKAKDNDQAIMVPPVEFEITCKHNNSSMSVSKFDGYIGRLIKIPEGVDHNKITTGIVYNKDGSFSHVPTVVEAIDGIYYARINSLTNSTYSIIWNEKSFEDILNHWSKEDVEDMSSRLVIKGVSEEAFEPDRSITRAEFATILVRSLGLMRGDEGKNIFNDVNKGDWYYEAVAKANEYGLIKGYEDNNFRPDAMISREEAMVMLMRAMKIVELDTDMTNEEIRLELEKFSDYEHVKAWAEKATAICVDKHIVKGDNNALKPTDNITRAETAAVIRRMLQKAELINK